MSTRRWTLEHRLGLISVIVGILACIVASVITLATPEIRLLLGLGSSFEVTTTPVAATLSSDTTTPELPIRSHPVLEYFPLYVGTSWTYSYAEETEGHGEDGGSIGGETSVITESVAMVTTSISDKIYLAKIVVAGRSILANCYGTSTLGSDAEYWMVADESRVFIACSKREATALAVELVGGPGAEYADSTPPQLPEFVFPLEEGRVWQFLADLPANEEDPAYQWHVESKLNVRVPAGTFTDCYRVQLFTLPDTTKRWVCPGIGIVAAEYNHHGAIHDYRAELVSYEIAGGE